ncbi:TM2 domain-containing protein [Nesterenkonia pannonica]|uniref:TM2 domain-containing protein n=1 Tax=Nesterenkonia pannonica TaxID=1548602 RepID=UPI002164334A|nr:TM2 domain-containing protein [Nesterenkonia pannonica]
MGALQTGGRSWEAALTLGPTPSSSASEPPEATDEPRASACVECSHGFSWCRRSAEGSGLALVLTILGFFFVAGLQYFYIGKYIKGILFLLTIGFFYVGTIISSSRSPPRHGR